ncbi:hypothetical protein CK219_26835 [Mesorhizobium sp. WSM4313]|nr:hypothetical protein CK219_26835 [Mesorhizobium sp. WSM4313]
MSIHVILATAYRIDLGRLSFLNSLLLVGIRCENNMPIFQRMMKRPCRGLYFVGPASANAYGRVARLLFGAKHPNRYLARHLARTLGRKMATGSESLPSHLGYRYERS